jgi:hypothetical protein
LLVVEGQDGVTAEMRHMGNQPASHGGGQKIAMIQFAAAGPGDSAVGTYQAAVKTQGLRDGERETVTSSRRKHSLHPLPVRPLQGLQIRSRNLRPGVQEGSVNVKRQQAQRQYHQ